MSTVAPIAPSSGSLDRSPHADLNFTFRSHLRDAEPLSSAAERDITTRLEALTVERTAIILGSPRIIQQILREAQKRPFDGADDGSALCWGATTNWLETIAATVAMGLSSYRLGSLALPLLDKQLDQIGGRLHESDSLKNARLTTNSALNLYRREIVSASSLTDENGPIHRLRAQRLEQVERVLTPLIDTLVSRNLRLVYAVARRFKVNGDLHDEVIAAGNLGLLRAAQGFKASVGVRFGTYAFKVIENEMIRSLTTRNRERRVGSSAPPEGALPRRVVSLSHELDSHREGGTLNDLIADKATPPPGREIERREDTSLAATIVTTCIEKLPEIERTVIKRFYGLEGAQSASIILLAAELGESRDQIRRTLDKAERRLRHLLETYSPRSLTALGLEDNGEENETLTLQERDGHSAPHMARTAEPLIEHALRGLTREAPLFPPTELFFKLVEEYTTALTQVRRAVQSFAEAPRPPAIEETNALHRFHTTLLGRWPRGFSQQRYGLQLEAEILTRKSLDSIQVKEIYTLQLTLQARLTELSITHLPASTPPRVE